MIIISFVVHLNNLLVECVQGRKKSICYQGCHIICKLFACVKFTSLLTDTQKYVNVWILLSRISTSAIAFIMAVHITLKAH